MYRRTLPSGGYVAIATEDVQPLFAQKRLLGRIVVERRGKERGPGHAAPVVAFAERNDVEEILAALMPLAESDELLAEALERRVTMPITRRRSSQGPGS